MPINSAAFAENTLRNKLAGVSAMIKHGQHKIQHWYAVYVFPYFSGGGMIASSHEIYMCAQCTHKWSFPIVRQRFACSMISDCQYFRQHITSMNSHTHTLKCMYLEMNIICAKCWWRGCIQTFTIFSVRLLATAHKYKHIFQITKLFSQHENHNSNAVYIGSNTPFCGFQENHEHPFWLHHNYERIRWKAMHY